MTSDRETPREAGRLAPGGERLWTLSPTQKSVLKGGPLGSSSHVLTLQCTTPFHTHILGPRNYLMTVSPALMAEEEVMASGPA